MNRFQIQQQIKSNKYYFTYYFTRVILFVASAWLLSLSFTVSSALAAQAQTELVVKADKNNPNIEQIYVQSYKDGSLVEKNISQFTHPHHITTDVGDWLVSDDERYAMFSHYDYPPNKIVVYDLKNNRRVSEFAPAYAGSLRWTGNNLVVLTYGCGTLCGGMRIFNIKGMLLNEIDLSENVYSPDSKYIAMYPWSMAEGKQLRIYRFDAIKGVDLVLDREHFSDIPENTYISHVEWLSNNRLKVMFNTQSYYASGMVYNDDDDVQTDDNSQSDYEKIIQLPK